MSSTFEAITSFYVEDVSDTTGEIPEIVRRATVAPRFNEVWGIAPAARSRLHRGRSPRPAGDASIVSDRYWRSRLGADPNVVGRQLRIGARHAASHRRDAGVVPVPGSRRGRLGAGAVDAPFMQSRGLRLVSRDRAPEARRHGRARPARTSRSSKRSSGRSIPTPTRTCALRASPTRTAIVAGARGSLWLLFGAASLLLLIACTNIATLLLTRGAERRREVAVRLLARRARVADRAPVADGDRAARGRRRGGRLLLASPAAACAALAVGERAAPRRDRGRRHGSCSTRSLRSWSLRCSAARCRRCGARAESWRAKSRAAAERKCRRASRCTGGSSAFRSRCRSRCSRAPVCSCGASRSSRASTRGFERAARAHVPSERRVCGHVGRQLPAIPARLRDDARGARRAAGRRVAATSFSLPGVPTTFEQEYELPAGHADPETPRARRGAQRVAELFRDARHPGRRRRVCRYGGGAWRGRGRRQPELRRALWRGRALVARNSRARSCRRSRRSPASSATRASAASTGRRRRPCTSATSRAHRRRSSLVRTRSDPQTIVATVRAKMKELEPLRAVFSVSSLDERIGDAYAENRLRTDAARAVRGRGARARVPRPVRDAELRRELAATRGRACASRSARCRARIVAQFVTQGVARRRRRVRRRARACRWGSARALSGMLFGVSPFDPVTLAGVVSAGAVSRRSQLSSPPASVADRSDGSAARGVSGVATCQPSTDANDSHSTNPSAEGFSPGRMEVMDMLRGLRLAARQLARNPVLQRDRRAHARARHRREHADLQRDRRRAVEAVAISRRRSNRARVSGQCERIRPGQSLESEFRGSQGADALVLGIGRVRDADRARGRR